VYTPPHFAVDDESTQAFLARIAAADLVTVTGDGLLATFLPLVFAPERGAHGALVGHDARKNDQWRAAIGEALVIAHGEDAYGMPSWYPSKAGHGRVVPTWNEMSQSQKGANVDGVVAGLTTDGRADVADVVQALRTR
jgi:transcriptional regulator